jgi:hypothetical protein
LRNYGNLKDTDKPLIVSGILLALRESEFKNFSIDDLTGTTSRQTAKRFMMLLVQTCKGQRFLQK